MIKNFVCDFEGTLKYLAWWLSWLERRPVTAEVVGSNPIRVAYFIFNEVQLYMGS